MSPFSSPESASPRSAARRGAMLLAAVATLLGAALMALDGGRTLAAGSLFGFAAIILFLWLARQEARQAARVRQEYLAGMGHELRTPLNSVIGFSNVLLRTAGTRLTAQERDYLGRVRANGEQLLRVVDELLRQDATATTTTTTTYAMSRRAASGAPSAIGGTIATSSTRSTSAAGSTPPPA